MTNHPFATAGALLFAVPVSLGAPTPLCEAVFVPDYRLSGRAGDVPPQAPPAVSIEQGDLAAAPSRPLLLRGQAPTERRTHLPCELEESLRAVTLEAWIIDHVNQPVGMLAGFVNHEEPDKSPLSLTYWDREVEAQLTLAHGETISIVYASNDPWKKLFHHLAAVWDGSEFRLVVNGETVASEPAAGGALANGPFEVAAYLANEPYMETGNLLRQVRLYGDALTDETISNRFEKLCAMADEGILLEDAFHFTARPYLHFATRTSMNILWETDVPARATLRYGTELPLERVLEFDKPQRLQEATLEKLEPAASYFYELVVENEAGERLESGTLTFQTAPRDNHFRFAAFADTEARPHVNQQIAQLVWGERPNFALNLGDLTDGGFGDRKFEWNYEYFLGMGALHGRVPAFTVPGNGEGDLVWYKHFHRYPGPENYYAFDYGNARFFMLDSNLPMGPGSEQYAWLRQELEQSDATWLFAGHHHPTYSSDEDDWGDTWTGASAQGDQNVRGIMPLYEEYGVDMVFFGHLHTYERTLPVAGGQVDRTNGVVYIQCGGAGGNLEDFAPTRSWFSRKTYRGHHYCMIAIEETLLEFQMFDSEGRLRDSFTIDKSIEPENAAAGQANNHRTKPSR